MTNSATKTSDAIELFHAPIFWITLGLYCLLGSVGLAVIHCLNQLSTRPKNEDANQNDAE